MTEQVIEKQKDWTVSEILDWTNKFFKTKNISESRLDAEVLLANSLNMKRLDLYLNFDQILSLKELADFKLMIQKRVKGMPVAYISGFKEFMGLKFKVSPNVLIPRPETEILVEEVIAFLKSEFQGDELTIVDTFTGSGNIPISLAQHLLKEDNLSLSATNLFIYGIDLNLKSVQLAHENNLLNQTIKNVKFLHGDTLGPLDVLPLADNVDIITANPPYIKTTDLNGLDKEVKFEPKMALDGGEDGLIFYYRLIEESFLLKYLKIGGAIFLEIDPELKEPILAKLKKNGFSNFKVIKDLQGLERIIFARRIS